MSLLLTSHVAGAALITNSYEIDLNTLTLQYGTDTTIARGSAVSVDSFNTNTGDVIDTTVNFYEGQSITFEGLTSFVTMYEDSSTPSTGSGDRQVQDTYQVTFFTPEGDITFYDGVNGFGGTLTQATDSRYVSLSGETTITGYQMISTKGSSLENHTDGHTWDQYWINYFRADVLTLNLSSGEPQIINVGDFEGGDLSDWQAQGNGEATVALLNDSNAMKLDITNPDLNEPLEVSQVITSLAEDFFLEFDFLFETATGHLDILLDNILIDTLWAADFFEHGLQHYSEEITNPDFLGRDDLLLTFALYPGSPATVLIDNISVQDTASVPEPTTIALLGLGLAGIGFSKKRKA